MSDTRRLASLEVHPEEVVVGPSRRVGVVRRRVDDVLAVLVPIRRPVDPLVVVRERLFAGAVRVDRVNLEAILLLAIGAEDDFRAVGREERPAVVAVECGRELLGTGAVRVHDEQLHVARVARAVDDLLPVGGVTPLGRVNLGVRRQALDLRAVRVRLVDLHVRVETPRVAPRRRPFLAVFFPLLELLFLVFLGVRVAVAGGEDHALAIGAEVGASGAAHTGADAEGSPVGQVLDEDLVEGVAGVLLLGLEDGPLAVGREVPFAGANEVARHLRNVLKVCRLGHLPIVGGFGTDSQREGKQESVHGEVPLGEREPNRGCECLSTEPEVREIATRGKRRYPRVPAFRPMMFPCPPTAIDPLPPISCSLP